MELWSVDAMNLHRERKISVVRNNGIDLIRGGASDHLASHAIVTRHGYSNLQHFESLSPDDNYGRLPRLESKRPSINHPSGDLGSCREKVTMFFGAVVSRAKTLYRGGGLSRISTP